MKALSQSEIHVLRDNICTLEETNTQLANEVSHLHASIDELYEEVAPLQANNNRFFDEYQILKEDYDALLLELIEKDEIAQGL